MDFFDLLRLANKYASPLQSLSLSPLSLSLSLSANSFYGAILLKIELMKKAHLIAHTYINYTSLCALYVEHDFDGNSLGSYSVIGVE